MTKPSQCAKCGGSMTEGFTVDNTHGGRNASSWAEGEPVPSFWVGVKLPGKVVAIHSYRCNRCGYLENYAPE